MTEQERFLETARVFEACRAVTGPERLATLRELCAHDEALRLEVEDLLSAHDDEEGRLHTAGAGSAAERIRRESLEPAPQRIGRYHVESLLGSGGMGVVYLASRESPRRNVALKVLPRRSVSESMRRRFEHEAQALGRLDHPNIAQIFDAGLHEERFYIASELIDGVEVDLLLRQHRAREGKEARLPLDITARLGLEMLMALDFAHRARVAEDEPLELIHRDVSLRNLMVTFRGELKVIDFGIAKAKLDEFKTATGALVGTPKYMSPDQIEGRPLDLRSDIYSAAVVLYELLGGRSMLEPGLSIVQVLQSVMNAQPPPLSSQNSELPEALDPIFDRALQKEPEDRFESASEFAAALQPYLQPLMASNERIASFVLELFPQRHARFAHVYSQTQPDPSEPHEPTVTAFELAPTKTVPTPLKPQAKSSSWQKPEVLALWLGATALSLTATYFTLRAAPPAPQSRPPIAEHPAPKARPSFVAAPKPPLPQSAPARETKRSPRRSRRALQRSSPPLKPKRAKPYARLERRLRKLKSDLESSQSLDIERVQLLFGSLEKAARQLPEGPQKSAVHKQLQRANKCLYTCTNPQELLSAAQRTLDKLQVSEAATTGPAS